MDQTGKDQERQMEYSLHAEVMRERNVRINNSAGSPTLWARYGLLGKWLKFARWKVGEILLQDEETTFEPLRGVNNLVFPGESGYQREILQTRSQEV